MNHNNHKELDEMYTIPEYRDLSSLLISARSSYYAFENALKVYIFNLNAPKTTRPSIVSSISEWFLWHNLEVYVMLYQIPFNLLPLYLNEDAIKSLVAVWRLGIGK